MFTSTATVTVILCVRGRWWMRVLLLFEFGEGQIPPIDVGVQLYFAVMAVLFICGCNRFQILMFRSTRSHRQSQLSLSCVASVISVPDHLIGFRNHLHVEK